MLIPRVSVFREETLILIRSPLFALHLAPAKSTPELSASWQQLGNINAEVKTSDSEYFSLREKILDKLCLVLRYNQLGGKTTKW